MITNIVRDVRTTVRHESLLAWIIVGSFFLPMIFGYLLPASFKAEVFASLVDKFESLAEGREGLGLVLPIFFNNATAAFFMLVSGVVVVLPVLMIVLNGLGIGILLDAIIRSTVVSGASIGAIVISILPHGILELPMIFLAALYGTLFGIKTVLGRRLRSGETRIGFFKETARVFIALILPVLLVAAVIEAVITPRLAEFVARRAVTQQFNAQELEPLAPSAEDFKKAGIEVEQVPIMSESETSLGPAWDHVRSYARLFEEGFYEKYRELKRRPLLARRFEGEGFSAEIWVRSFPNAEAAEASRSFERATVESALKDEQIAYGASIYDSALVYQLHSQPPGWYVFDSVGPYTYTMRLSSTTEEVVKELIAAERTLMQGAPAK